MLCNRVYKDGIVFAVANLTTPFAIFIKTDSNLFLPGRSALRYFVLRKYADGLTYR